MFDKLVREQSTIHSTKVIIGGQIFLFGVSVFEKRGGNSTTDFTNHDLH